MLCGDVGISGVAGLSRSTEFGLQRIQIVTDPPAHALDRGGPLGAVARCSLPSSLLPCGSRCGAPLTLASFHTAGNRERVPDQAARPLVFSVHLR
jgi:hypothetical protein